METDRHLFAHARPDPDVPAAEQSPHALRWAKLTYDEPPRGDGRRVICGHTAQSGGQPRAWPGWCCVDTKVYAPDGWLTALQIAGDAGDGGDQADQVWQANQAGEVRGPVALATFGER